MRSRLRCSTGVRLRKGLLTTGLAATLTGLFSTFADSAILQQSEGYVADLQAGWSQFLTWLERAFRESPAIVLGVAVALVVPFLACLGLLLRRRPAGRALVAAQVPKTAPASALQVRGALTDSADGGERYIINQGLVRIGREDDNDVQLMHNTVHRYHAVIERSPEAEFVIVDVSGADGNGVRVDGVRRERSRLRGGEKIEIGRVPLWFQLIQL